MASSKTVIEEDRLPSMTSDRERVFDVFRQWGYLEADLDPLGFLHPSVRPELKIEGELAKEARQVYCSTVGAELMHIADRNGVARSKRAWKAHSLRWTRTMCLINSCGPTCLSRSFSSGI